MGKTPDSVAKDAAEKIENAGNDANLPGGIEPKEEDIDKIRHPEEQILEHDGWPGKPEQKSA